jgi:hypothetical protein
MGGFRHLNGRLDELARIPSQVSRPIADRLNELLTEQWNTESDPYGEPWEPLAESTKKAKGHDTILIDTGELAAGTMAVPRAGAGIDLVSLDYGQYHQTGTTRMPRRPIFPDGQSLPESWQEAIQDEVSAAFGKVLK